VIEDVKVRTLFTMQVPQKKDYFGLKKGTIIEKDEADRLKKNVERMRTTMT
jgi:hypothetical protein